MGSEGLLVVVSLPEHPSIQGPCKQPTHTEREKKRMESRKGGGGIALVMYEAVVSLECGDLAQRHVGERSNGDLMSLSSQVSNTLSCVADIIHTYAPIQPSIHVVGMVHIPCTCPHWA